MAKTPKMKKKGISVHSRAARRANSPTIAIKDVGPAPRQSTYIPPQPSGIRKNKAPKTKAQKLRQKKGVERADIIAAQLEARLEKSVDKAKIVKTRRKDWDDINVDGKSKKQDLTTRHDVAGQHLTELPIRMPNTAISAPQHDIVPQTDGYQGLDDDI